jgi:hypothetical protein
MTLTMLVSQIKEEVMLWCLVGAKALCRESRLFFFTLGFGHEW